MNQPFFIISIVCCFLFVCSCNTNSSLKSAKKVDDVENNDTHIDSLDTDTSGTYIYTNIPANLRSETDSVVEILQSIQDSFYLVTKIRQKLKELEFHPVSTEDHFLFLRKRFNRRTYVSISDTTVRNKKIIISSYFWDKGEKYNNVHLYLTDPE